MSTTLIEAIDSPRPTDPFAALKGPQGRSAIGILLGAQFCFLMVVFVLLIWVRAQPEQSPMQVAGMSAEELEKSILHLTEERSLRLSELETLALFENQRPALEEFIQLQIQSAELSLQDLQWSGSQLVGEENVVELSLQLEGSYYNLPILIDALFQQNRLMVVEKLSVETPELMSAHTKTELILRFFQPASPPQMWLRASVGELMLQPGIQVDRLYTAMLRASEVKLIEAFQQRSSDLQSQSQTNRSQVMRSLPGLLRQLPRSALGWMGLERQGELLVTLTQPP